MTEVEYVIANFSERFADFRDKRIVLHGSRNYAEAIIDDFAGSFNFIGIMSLDPLEGGSFHGLDILHDEDLSALNIDVVILTERVRYEVEAFYSIWQICRKNNVEVFNMYGVNEILAHEEANNTEPFDLEKIKKLCSLYDIVAFEVMDTVICLSTGIMGISLREVFYDLVTYLREQGKKIRFSLRKSFPSDIQIDTLKMFDLIQDEKNEVIYRTGEDLSFRTLRENNIGEKILYFGCGIVNEFILPRCYGIDTYRFIGSNDTGPLIPVNIKVKQAKPREISILSQEEIKGKILEKSLISFDIFDTLLMRKTLYPRDVIFLVEQKAKLAGYNIKGYAKARIRAEEDQPFCNFNQIYDWLGIVFNWTEETKQQIKKLELKTEQEVLVVRTEVVELLRFACESGKRVVLTSDMYFPEEILSVLLTEFGISGYERVFVSCDEKKSKHTGLYKELLPLCKASNEILHIGDNPIADGTDCEASGIESVLVPSSLELARSTGWEKSIQAASFLMDRCLLGLVVSKIFSNPFQAPDLLKCTGEERAKRFGISVIAPIAVSYLTWLIQRLREKTFDGVLFLARDGWILYRIFEWLCTWNKLPKPIYYYANRHAAFLCCADKKSELGYIVASGQISGLSPKLLLKKIFHVPENKMLPYVGEENYTEYVEKHIDIIHKNVMKNRAGYLRYSDCCGMTAGGTYAVVDFIAVGHIQEYLSQFLPYHFNGFYFWNYTLGSPLNNKTEYYLKSNNSYLLQTYIEKLETFFTSPEPSQKRMSEQGIPVFYEEYRTLQELNEIKSVLELAEDFAREYFAVFYKNEGVITPSLVEEIYSAENYPVVNYTICDDWFRGFRRKREDSEKSIDEKI